MNKLHPRAVWLFCFRYFLLILVLLVFFLPLLFPFIMSVFIVAPSTTYQVWLIVIASISIISYVLAYATYKFWGYELADNAVKIEKGILIKKYISIPYERIQNVDISRGIFARILGLSDLHIQTAGYSGRKNFGEAEGKIPGISHSVAEKLREELVNRTKTSKHSL